MAFLITLASPCVSFGLQYSSVLASIGCVSLNPLIRLIITGWLLSFIILARIFSALYSSHSLLVYAVCSLGIFFRPKCLFAALVMIFLRVFHCLFRFWSWGPLLLI